MAASKPHVLVSRAPVPTGSDAEYKNDKHLAGPECGQGPVFLSEAQSSPNLLNFTWAETLTRLPRYLGITEVH